jgi:hypothetical protein
VCLVESGRKDRGEDVWAAGLAAQGLVGWGHEEEGEP